MAASSDSRPTIGQLEMVTRVVPKVGEGATETLRPEAPKRRRVRTRFVPYGRPSWHPPPTMTRYLVLLRGINVGGKNKVPMAALRELLESHGHTKVSTYIASGNVILSSDQSAASIKRELEEALPKTFKLDSELVAVLVLTRAQLRAVVRDRPKGFGDKPDTYHSDAVFLMGIDAPTAMKVFDPRPGVDEVWPGKGVIYSQRLSAQRTKSRLNKIVGTPAYKSMTIRSWATTLALRERMEAPEEDA